MRARIPALRVGNRKIGLSWPTYFIADIAANHDGKLSKAKRLITLAKKAGADAAKFQHFRAEKIVSRFGFEAMRGRLSHQSKWKKSVYRVYEEASVPWDWTPELVRHCKKERIDFFSAPYDLEAIDMLNAHMDMYKIGSGDLSWPESLERIARKGKAVFLATGASSMKEVEEAVRRITSINPHLCLMQCNTNYTGSAENFKYIHLNVLKAYAKRFPKLVLGLSDHTPGHATVLGAIALGARAIEKHFTDDRSNPGPDHPFSMDPKSWRDMVDRARELERSLGMPVKRVEDNERDTVLIQRRCLRASRALKAGHRLTRGDIDVLRPVTPGAILPAEITRLIGCLVRKDMPHGEAFRWSAVDLPR